MSRKNYDHLSFLYTGYNEALLCKTLGDDANPIRVATEYTNTRARTCTHISQDDEKYWKMMYRV